jgi:hypothetical protein
VLRFWRHGIDAPVRCHPSATGGLRQVRTKAHLVKFPRHRALGVFPRLADGLELATTGRNAPLR